MAVFFEKKKEEGWQGMRDSNSQHAVLETAALPIELIPYNLALSCSGRRGDDLTAISPGRGAALRRSGHPF